MRLPVRSIFSGISKRPKYMHESRSREIWVAAPATQIKYGERWGEHAPTSRS